MAIEISPNFAMPYLNRAVFKLEILKEYENALKDVNKAIGLNSKYSNAYYQRAIIKNKLGDSEGYKIDINNAANLGHEKSTKLLKEILQND
jgi:tetratricopeptide (TPR) repeat protein